MEYYFVLNQRKAALKFYDENRLFIVSGVQCCLFRYHIQRTSDYTYKNERRKMER